MRTFVLTPGKRFAPGPITRGKLGGWGAGGVGIKGPTSRTGMEVRNGDRCARPRADRLGAGGEADGGGGVPSRWDVGERAGAADGDQWAARTGEVGGVLWGDTRE